MPFDPFPNRREMIRSMAALVAGGLTTSLSSPLCGADCSGTSQEQANISLGFSLYGMRTLDTAEALATCARIGYGSVELVCTSGWPCDPVGLSPSARSELRKRLTDLNLKLPALMENLTLLAEPAKHRDNLDRLQAAAQLGAELSPGERPVVETILGGRPQQWESVKNQMVDRLRQWAEVADRQETTIAVKPHVGGALHTPQAARWLIEQVDHPRIRLTYDFSHFSLRGESLQDSLALLVDRTAFIHVKDTSGTLESFRFLLPGDGEIDYGAYLTQLQKHGYRGSVVVEVSGQIHGKPDYDPIKAAEHSYAHLSAAFQAAGLGLPATERAG